VSVADAKKLFADKYLELICSGVPGVVQRARRELFSVDKSGIDA